MTENITNNNVPPFKANSQVDYSEKVLEVKNLKKHFFLGSGAGKIVVPAVDDVSFDVYKREVFGLVGESGCGKTTTGRTIIKLYNPTEGTVDLNGIRIGAGYLNHVAEIKRLKKQAKEDILSLDATKSQAIQFKKKADFEVSLVKGDIKKTKEELFDAITKAKEPLSNHRDELYLLKNQYLLDSSQVKYDTNLEKLRIIATTENEFEVELQDEIKIADTMYKNKVDGLKDSAALTKTEIEKRLAALKVEHDEKIVALEAEFRPKIQGEATNLVSKQDAKVQLAALKSQSNKNLAELKAKYAANRSKIQAPDKVKVANKVKEVKSEFTAKIVKLKEKIKAIYAQAKSDIVALPKTGPLNDDQKRKALEIKAEAQSKILEEKNKIRDIKSVNNSRDTIKASQKMQMIFQDPISSLNPRMTVKEIIGEGLRIQGGYDSETINNMVGEVLEIVGLSPEYATRYPHEFSGGQRQRIGIARALIMNPNFIIADEPISALDVSIRAQVINLLTNLREKLGLTMLFIAHDLSVVRFFCDRIAVMYYGKIVEMAPSHELFENPQHPYTISLLSAIPQPDPDYEKGRKRIHYNPSQHDYRIDKPSLKEINPGHFVFVNDKEFKEMKANYKQTASASSQKSRA
jgi:oligopeptide transport system ATP-binding protein